jgi:hypothetical protein
MEPIRTTNAACSSCSSAHEAQKFSGVVGLVSHGLLMACLFQLFVTFLD